MSFKTDQNANGILRFAGYIAMLLLVVIGEADEPVTSYEGVPLSAWLERLASSDNEERELATRAVRSMGTNGIPLLRRYRGSKDSWVRKKASELLSSVGGDDYLPAAAAERRRLARLGYDAFDASVARALIGRLDNPSLLYGHGEPVYEAIRDLSRIGTEAVPELIDALTHENASIRYHAATSLGWQVTLLSEESVGPLIMRLRDDTWIVRARAAAALANIKLAADRCVPALVVSLSDPNPIVRYASVSALGKFGPAASGALPALRRLLKSLNAVVPQKSVSGITKPKTPAEIRAAVESALSAIVKANGESHENILP